MKITLFPCRISIDFLPVSIHSKLVTWLFQILIPKITTAGIFHTTAAMGWWPLGHPGGTKLPFLTPQEKVKLEVKLLIAHIIHCSQVSFLVLLSPG